MKHLKRFNETDNIEYSEFWKKDEPRVAKHELTAEEIVDDIASKMGVSRREATAKLIEFGKKLDKLKCHPWNGGIGL